MNKHFDQAPQIPKRRWQPDAPALSVIGVGCGRAGSLNNLVPVAEIERTLSKALDYGINVFDTANIYAQGDSERIIGRVLAGRRDKAFVITKVGLAISKKVELVRRLKPFLRVGVRYSTALRDRLLRERAGAALHDLSIDSLGAAVERCLQRLRFDTLDALLLHEPPIDVLRDPEIADFLRRLRSDGKIRHFGADVATLEEVEQALAIDGLSMLQMDLSLARRLEGHSAGSAIKSRAIGLIVRQILHPQGEDHSTASTPIGPAISSALNVPGVTCAVIGMSTRAHLDQNVGALRAAGDKQ